MGPSSVVRGRSSHTARKIPFPMAGEFDDCNFNLVQYCGTEQFCTNFERFVLAWTRKILLVSLTMTPLYFFADPSKFYDEF